MPHKTRNDGQAPAGPFATPAPLGAQEHFAGRELGKGAPMPRMPRDKSFDSTLALIRDPYRFISNGAVAMEQTCSRRGFGCARPSA